MKRLPKPSEGGGLQPPIPRGSRFLKRTFDIVGSSIGLLLTSWLIVSAWAVMTVTMRQNGMFTQLRVGRNGKPFKIYKIRTMRTVSGIDTTVTTSRDPRLTWPGKVMRRFKLDELPQLWNVLKGDMSFVGPRPDVAGFADRLQGDDRLILAVRPGITGPATLRFRNEEKLLARQDDPESFNREVLYPCKVALNLDYIRNYSFLLDLRYIWWTVAGQVAPARRTTTCDMSPPEGNAAPPA